MNSRSSSLLFDRHPLAASEQYVRLMYLSGIALAVASDRELMESEKIAFLQLAESLSVDEIEAGEIIQERASVSENDLDKIFSEIRLNNFSSSYLLDLVWLMLSDGTLDVVERDVLMEISQVLGLEKGVQFVIDALHSIKAGDVREMFNFLTVSKDVVVKDRADLHGFLENIIDGRLDFESNLAGLFCVTNNDFEVVKWDITPQFTFFSSNEINTSAYETSLKWRISVGEGFKSGDVIAEVHYRRTKTRWSDRKYDLIYYEDGRGFETVLAPFDGFLLRKHVADGVALNEPKKYLKGPTFDVSEAEFIADAYRLGC